MKAFNRVNPHGVRIFFTELLDGSTHIRTLKNHIIVNHPIDRLRQSFYYWSITGMFIQDAFDYLNADEREFIKTGITVDGWNRIFKSTDGVEK